VSSSLVGRKSTFLFFLKRFLIMNNKCFKKRETVRQMKQLQQQQRELLNSSNRHLTVDSLGL
jgi:hypothetical protein